MTAELGNILEMAPGVFPCGQRVTVVEAGADASFIIHHFINQAMKASKKLVLVTLAQSFSHYSNVASKLGGTSLTAQRDRGNLIVLELLKEIGLGMVNIDSNESCNVQDSTQTTQNKVATKSNQIDIAYQNDKQTDSTPQSFDISMLQRLYQRISTIVQQFNDDTYIIIDDMSLLLSLGFDTSSVRLFLHYSNDMVRANKTTCLVQLIHSNDDPRSLNSADEELDHVTKYLCHVTSVLVIVTGLPSGYCRDVHGELTVRWQSSDVTPRPQKRMQFKVLDKSVKFFAAGMSSAVL